MSQQAGGGFLVPPHLARFIELRRDYPKAAEAYLCEQNAAARAFNRRLGILTRAFTRPAHGPQRAL